jgi:hypothetical protein
VSGCDPAFETAAREVRRLEVSDGALGRRRRSPEAKARAESLAPGLVASEGARRHDLLPRQPFAGRPAGAAGAAGGGGVLGAGDEGARGAARGTARGADRGRGRRRARPGAARGRPSAPTASSCWSGTAAARP